MPESAAATIARAHRVPAPHPPRDAQDRGRRREELKRVEREHDRAEGRQARRREDERVEAEHTDENGERRSELPPQRIGTPSHASARSSARPG